MANTPSTKKAAESRAAAAQDPKQAPAERQTPDGQQQTAAPAGSGGTSGSSEPDVKAELEALVERAEAAAERAEAAASAVENGQPVEPGPTVAEKKPQEPAIGTPEWQKQNQLSALREELGFAEAKGQDDRVKAIKASIARVEKG